MVLKAMERQIPGGGAGTDQLGPWGSHLHRWETQVPPGEAGAGNGETRPLARGWCPQRHLPRVLQQLWPSPVQKQVLILPRVSSLVPWHEQLT